MTNPIKTRTIYERYYEPEKDHELSNQFYTYYKPGGVFISLEGNQITLKSSPSADDAKTYHVDQIRNVIHFLDEVSK